MTSIQSLVATTTSGVAFAARSATKLEGMSTRRKIGIVLGIVLGIFTVGLAVGWVLWRRPIRKRHAQEQEKQKEREAAIAGQERQRLEEEHKREMDVPMLDSDQTYEIEGKETKADIAPVQSTEMQGSEVAELDGKFVAELPGSAPLAQEPPRS